MGGGNSRAFRRFWDCFRSETWFYSVIDVYDISFVPFFLLFLDVSASCRVSRIIEDSR